VIDAAREGGLLIIKCGLHRNVIRCLCPLVASDRDVAAAVRILDQAFERTAA
jgi:4-aminobutyrate aminotransferase/(S)-3-amino-2-methylpropionate transaminase